MPNRSLLVAALLAATVATSAGAQMRTASIGVSATVIASCRVEIPAQVELRSTIPSARLTCPPSSRPAVRTVIDAGTDFRWVRYDVEY